jgi:iron-sulfur cluster repair protein YtfE (RIC family)
MFEPNTSLIGETVYLTEHIKVISGTFKKGTKMKVVEAAGTQGYNLQDDAGNVLSECLSSSFELKSENKEKENSDLIDHYKKVGFGKFQEQLIELANAVEDVITVLNNEEDTKLYRLLRQLSQKIK